MTRISHLLPWSALALVSGIATGQPATTAGAAPAHDRAEPRAAFDSELARNDCRDPGWFKHPPGSVAYEWTGCLPEPARAAQPPADARTMSARKPNTRQH